MKADAIRTREPLTRPRELGRDPLPVGLPPWPGPPVLWAARTTAPDPELLDTAALDPGERRRAAGFRSGADRVAYTVAHVALRRLLGGILAVDPARIRYTREPCPGCGGPHGRPAVRGAPLHFSLSRTRGLVLLAFAGHPIGADVERLPSQARLERLTPALHAHEQAQLAALPPGARAGAFVRCWTRKEAWLKGTGEGIGTRLTAATLVGAGTRPLQRPGWRLADIAAPEGFAAAYAVRTAPPQR